MDDDNNENPSEINSFKMLDLKKKRKLNAEQLGLPTSKHKCTDLHRLHPEALLALEQNKELENLLAHIAKENAERRAIDYGSDKESAKDSNSFFADSESSMSISNEVSKAWPSERPSSSSYDFGGSSSEGFHSVSENMTEKIGGEEKLKFTLEGHDPIHHYIGLQVSQNLDEHIQEFGSHFDYSCGEYENDSIQPYTDKEIDDVLFPNSGNQNVYVLSSGRWNVNQDVQSGAKIPTIDQEFEQYFSTLML